MEADNSGRGKQFEKNKLAVLDALHTKIKSVNDQFVSDAGLVGLDSAYYISKYSAGIGGGSTPSEKAAMNQAAMEREKAEARWRRNSELSDQFLGCLYQTLATGCFLLVILAGLVMLFFATIMIMFI